MPCLLLRVTHIGDNFKEIPKFTKILEELCIWKCLGIHHYKKKGNPHTHFVIEGDVSSQNLRYYCQKHFVKKTYSLVTCNDNEEEITASYSYLFHENSSDENICFNLDISEKEVNKFKELNSKIQREYREKSKKKKECLIDQIYKDLMERISKLTFDEMGKIVHPRRLYGRRGYIIIEQLVLERMFVSKTRMENTIFNVLHRVAQSRKEMVHYVTFYHEYFSKHRLDNIYTE